MNMPDMKTTLTRGRFFYSRSGISRFSSSCKPAKMYSHHLQFVQQLPLLLLLLLSLTFANYSSPPVSLEDSVDHAEALLGSDAASKCELTVNDVPSLAIFLLTKSKTSARTSLFILSYQSSLLPISVRTPTPASRVSLCQLAAWSPVMRKRFLLF